jgi:hypothetical protein
MTPKRHLPNPAEPPPADSPEVPASTGQDPEFLALLSAPRAKPSWPSEPSFVATCVDTTHPSLRGRVRVSWAHAAGDAPQSWWVPTLQGLALRSGDRVLVSRAGGLPEPIVVGVVDGFEERPEPSQRGGPTVEIQPDEVLTIAARDGQPLVEIRQGPDGPSVRLLSPDTQIELPGRLSISAAELSLKARRGNVEIEASDQVVVTGETVKLN